MFFIFLALMGFQQETQPTVGPYSPERVEIWVLHGLDSPTGLILEDDRWLAASDTLEPRPGIFQLSFEAGRKVQAYPWAYFHRYDLEAFYGDDRDQLWLVSERRHEGKPKTWRGSLVAVDRDRFHPITTIELDQEIACPDESMACGPSALIAKAGTTFWVMRKQKPAQVMTMQLQGRQLQVVNRKSVYWGRKSCTITGVRRIGGYVYMLVRDHWVLGRLPLSDVLESSTGKPLRLETVFDFSALRHKFRADNAAVFYAGLAEAFEINPAGELFIVLNNRGFPYQPATEIADHRPRILRFFPNPSKTQ